MITHTLLAAIEAANEREAARHTVEQEQSVRAFRAEALRVFGSELFELFPRFMMGLYDPCAALIDTDDAEAVRLRQTESDAWIIDSFGHRAHVEVGDDIARNFDRLLIAIGSVLSTEPVVDTDDMPLSTTSRAVGLQPR